MPHRLSKADKDAERRLKRLDYIPEEDIYNQAKEDKDIDPDDIGF